MICCGVSLNVAVYMKEKLYQNHFFAVSDKALLYMKIYIVQFEKDQNK